MFLDKIWTRRPALECINGSSFVKMANVELGKWKGSGQTKLRWSQKGSMLQHFKQCRTHFFQSMFHSSTTALQCISRILNLQLFRLCLSGLCSMFIRLQWNSSWSVLACTVFHNIYLCVYVWRQWQQWQHPTVYQSGCRCPLTLSWAVRAVDLCLWPAYLRSNTPTNLFVKVCDRRFATHTEIWRRVKSGEIFLQQRHRNEWNIYLEHPWALDPMTWRPVRWMVESWIPLATRTRVQFPLCRALNFPQKFQPYQATTLRSWCSKWWHDIASLSFSTLPKLTNCWCLEC